MIVLFSMSFIQVEDGIEYEFYWDILLTPDL